MSTVMPVSSSKSVRHQLAPGLVGARSRASGCRPSPAPGRWPRRARARPTENQSCRIGCPPVFAVLRRLVAGRPAAASVRISCRFAIAFMRKAVENPACPRRSSGGDHAQVVKAAHPAARGIDAWSIARIRSFVSAQQVAELAGVSRSAVSRTFTDGASVSDATRRKVLQAADELGYHVNHLARSLIQEQSGIVCLIVADVATPYQARMLDALTRRLQAIDRVAMVINTSGESGGVEAALRQTLNYRAAATHRPLRHAAGGAGHHLHQQRPAGDPHQPRRPARRADQHLGRQCRRGPRGAAHARPLRVPADRRRLLDRRDARASSPASAPSPRRRRSAGLEASVVRAGPTGYAAGFEAGRDPAQRLGAAGRGLLRHRPARLRLHGRGAPRVRPRRCRRTSASSASTTSSRPAGPPTTSTTFRQPIDAIADHVMTLDRRAGRGGRARRCFHAAPVWRRSVRPR